MGGPDAKRVDHINRHSQWNRAPNTGKRDFLSPANTLIHTLQLLFPLTISKHFQLFPPLKVSKYVNK